MIQLAKTKGSLRTLRCFFSSTDSHTHELLKEYNETNRHDEFLSLYQPSAELIKGYATSAGTTHFSKRSELVHAQNWRSPSHLANQETQQLKVSSIGIGTYTGDLDTKTDVSMFNAIVDSVMSGGVNHIDTCTSYRCSKSERVINAALKYLFSRERQPYTREELFIATKLGYLADDADSNKSSKEVIAELVKRKLIEESDVVNNAHCVHPAYLDFALERSRINLGLETLDVVYLNNFAENHKHLLNPEEFWYKMSKTFEFFEQKVQQGKIRAYGLASWSALRASHRDSKHLSVDEVVHAAEKVAGKNHHLRYLQTPINLAMPEAFGERNQMWHSKANDKKEAHSLLTVAHRHGINVVACSPLLNGTLINVPLPSEELKCSFDGAKHLQFIRSIPAPALFSVLIGQKRNRHVKTNLEVVTVERLNDQEWMEFMRPSHPKQEPSKPLAA